ncbi:hypothetical protein V8C37DRAFT_392211 [Trichoderma ceciliae]
MVSINPSYMYFTLVGTCTCSVLLLLLLPLLLLLLLDTVNRPGSIQHSRYAAQWAVKSSAPPARLSLYSGLISFYLHMAWIRFIPSTEYFVRTCLLFPIQGPFHISPISCGTVVGVAFQLCHLL